MKILADLAPASEYERARFRAGSEGGRKRKGGKGRKRRNKCAGSPGQVGRAVVSPGAPNNRPASSDHNSYIERAESASARSGYDIIARRRSAAVKAVRNRHRFERHTCCESDILLEQIRDASNTEQRVFLIRANRFPRIPLV